MAVKNGTSKQNVLIALTMLGFFVIVGLVSLFSVYALATSQVNSNINVSYETESISANVSANYWISGANKSHFSGGVNGTQYILADAPNNDVKSLSFPNNLALTKTNNKIIFEFVFENTSEEIGFTIDLDSSPIKNTKTKNMVEKYYVSDTEISVANYESIVWQNNLSTISVQEGEGNKKYIYIEANIYSLVKDSNYEGGFKWSLAKIV